MDELVIDNLVYIPSKKAAAITGYAKDYVGQLCREGRIEAKLVGRSWYVLESSVREHRFGKVASSPVESAPVFAKEELTHALEVPEQASQEPLAATAGVSEEVWESPRYTAEPVEEVYSVSPTYLTNTTDKEIASSHSQIEEVQSAWQEWFSKKENEPASTVEQVEVEEVSEPVSASHEELETEVEAQEDHEPEEIPVEVSIVRNREPARAMDMVTTQEYYRPQTASRSQYRTEKARVVPRRVKKGQSIALRAVFVAFIILIIAVTVIGTGSLEAVNPSWSRSSSAIDFLAGVKNVEK